MDPTRRGASVSAGEESMPETLQQTVIAADDVARDGRRGDNGDPQFQLTDDDGRALLLSTIQVEQQQDLMFR